jgi:hypothetical protein
MFEWMKGIIKGEQEQEVKSYKINLDECKMMFENAGRSE